MKKFAVVVLVLIAATTLSINCGSPSQKEYDKLKVENAQLKAELDELKYGADKLYSDAELFFKNKEYSKAKECLNKLLIKHPTSPQAIKGKTFLDNVETAIKIEAEKRDKEEKRRLAEATKSMRSKHDDVKGITWYSDKTTPVYPNINSFHLYFGKENNRVLVLRLKIQYAGDDWLFIESYSVKTDDKTYLINLIEDVDRDNGYSGVWEWYDVPLDKNSYEVVNAIINSKVAKLRYNGNKYYKDRLISNSERKALKNVITAYESLGGIISF